jgi:DNA-binding MarR family transcriptional regulator
MDIKESEGIAPESDIKLWLLLGITWNMISRLHDLEVSQLGITQEQSTILRLIQERDNVVTARYLENVTMRQQNTISVLVKRMMKTGLLTRVKKPHKREFEISLTKKGQNQLKEVKMQAIDMAFSCLNKREKHQLATCLYPIYKKAHDLLVMSHEPPFVRLISDPRIYNIWIPGDDLSNEKLWILMDRASFGVFRLSELESNESGLTMMHNMVLRILYENGGKATYKTLEDTIMRQRHSISSLINRMVIAGLVNKENSPSGKAYTVSFTKKGEEIYQHVRKRSIKVTVSSLTENQKQRLTTLLNTVNVQARELLGI